MPTEVPQTTVKKPAPTLGATVLAFVVLGALLFTLFASAAFGIVLGEQIAHRLFG